MLLFMNQVHLFVSGVTQRNKDTGSVQEIALG